MEQSSKTLKEKLFRLRGEEAKHRAVDDALLRDAEPLQTKLTEALERFAQGDTSQERVIEEIKKKLKPIQSRREGLASLMGRIGRTITETEELLRDAKAIEAAEEKHYLEGKRSEKQAGLNGKTAEISAEMKLTWTRFGELLGEKQVIEARLSDYADRTPFPSNLMAEIVNFAETQGFKKCPQPGYIGQWLPHAILKVEGDGAVAYPADEAKRRDDQDAAAWAAEWRKEKGLE